MSVYTEIQTLIERIGQTLTAPDAACETIGRVFEGKPVERLPFLFRSTRGAVAPGTKYSLKEQFYDPEKMLYGHLEEILRAAPLSRGAPLTMRPNFGTVFVPAAFGARYEVFPDVYPWITGHFSQDDIPRLQEADVLASPIFIRCVEYIRFFKETLPGWIHVYQPDTQGPFDIAHLLLGNDLFYLLTDDPDAAHALLRAATRGYCEITRAVKEALGEKTNEMYHGHALSSGIYMKNGGARVSEDTPTLLSPAMIDEFVLPYDEQALAAFGGGFIHFCGKHEYLLEKFAALPLNRAINLGNPEMYDFRWVMNALRRNGRAYFGHWPKEPGEDARAYVKRMRSVSDGGTSGLMLHMDEGLFPEIGDAGMLEIWNGGNGK